MNALYIGLGSAIVLALVAALLGPLFIDWTAYRAVFEREATRIVGRPVVILGDLDIRLLPLPSLRLTDVAVGERDNPVARAAGFEARLELAPLLRGELRVADLRLERPTISVTLDRAGGIDILPGFTGAAAPVSPEAIRIDSLVVSRGTIELKDRASGRTYAVTKLDGELEAASLLGPIKFEGAGRIADEPLRFRLATAKAARDLTLPFKLHVASTERPVAVTLDATLRPGRRADFSTGALVLARTAGSGAGAGGEPFPYRIESKFVFEPGRLTLENMQVTAGTDAQAVTLSGNGTVDLARNRRFDVALAAKQIDLDHLIGDAGSAAADLAGALARLGPALQRLPLPDLPGRIVVDAAGVTVGGGFMRDIRLEAAPRARGFSVDAFEAQLPGRTRVLARGVLSDDRGLGFRGHLALASEQPQAFAAWWRKSAEMPELPPLSLDTEIEARQGVLSLAGIDLRLGEAAVKGEAEWSEDRGAPRFEARLSADSLDLDRLGALADLLAGAESATKLGWASTRVELDASTLAAWGFAADFVGLAFERRGGDVRIERLSVGDLAGLSIEASGDLRSFGEAPDGTVAARLRAEKLDRLAPLVDRLGLSETVRARVSAALAASAPLDLALSVDAKPASDRASSDVRLSLAGTLGPTRLDWSARFSGRPETWRDGRLSLATDLSGPDAGRLLRLTGLDLPGVPLTSPAKLSLTAEGVPAAGLDVTGAFEGLGGQAQARGRADLSGKALAWRGVEARIETSDAVPLLLAAGLPFGNVASALPARLVARLEGNPERIDIADFSGEIDRVLLKARGRLALDGAVPRFDGSAEIPSLDVETLVELALGFDALRAEGTQKSGLWPTRPFAGPLATGLAGDIALNAGRIAVLPGRTLDKARLVVRLRPGQIMLDEIAGDFAGGRIAGNVRFQPAANGDMGIGGSAQFAGIAVERLLPPRKGAPPVSGRADATLSFEATGKSVAGLMATLSGAGAVEIRNAVVARLDPRAIERVVKATDEGLSLEPPRIRAALAGMLDAGPLLLTRATGTLGAAAGLVRIKDVAAEAPNARLWGGGTLDLARGAVDAAVTLRVDAGKEAVTGADPEFTVLLTGPIVDPTRSLDVSPLATYLTLRAVEREVERIEALQIEIHERGRLDREMKHFIRQRLERETSPRAALPPAPGRTAPPPPPPTPRTEPAQPSPEPRAQPVRPPAERGAAPILPPTGSVGEAAESAEPPEPDAPSAPPPGQFVPPAPRGTDAAPLPRGVGR